MLIKTNRTSGTPRHARRSACQPHQRRSRSPHLPAPLRSRGRRARRDRRAAACERAQGGGRRIDRPARARPSARTSARIARSAARVIAEVENGVWVGQEPAWDSADQPRLALRQGRGDARAGARRPPPEISDEARGRPVDQDFLGHGDQRDRRQADGDPRQVGAGFGLLAGLGQVHQRRRPISIASSRRSGEPTTPTTRRASVIPPRSPASPIPGATAR